MSKKIGLLFMIVIIMFIFSCAVAEDPVHKDTPEGAWKLLEDDNVLDALSMGSESFKNKLRDVLFTGNTKIGGSYYQGKNKQCYGFALDAINRLVGKKWATGNRLNDPLGLHGETKFTESLFSSKGIPRGRVTLIRTASTSLVHPDDPCKSPDLECRHGDNYGHSMVLLYYNNKYVYYIDGNTGCNRLWRRTWDDWTKTQLTNNPKGLRKIKYGYTISTADFQKLFPDIYTIEEDNIDA